MARLTYVCCGLPIRPYAGVEGAEGEWAGSMWAADALFLCGSKLLVLHALITVVQYYNSGVVFHPLLTVNSKVT